MKERGAGTLMHITSLPSAFGIGDLGAEARKFADFLNETNQQYWQILPLNPISDSQFYSPYSSTSSMAGNTLLICPEQLSEDGLLDADKLTAFHLPNESHADFQQAEKNKTELFQEAWETFKNGKFSKLEKEFKKFCETEEDWLHDYSHFVSLKRNHRKLPWYDWPEEFKNRDKKALESFEKKHADEIEKEKWLQFLFFRQWKSLREYCREKGVSFFGDVPIYVSHESVDVWANKEYFQLDEDGQMTGIAGVPPDYFSEEGQLWGMPVFRWDVLKKNKYDWWVQRLRVNMKLYDLIRIDHFRAFADYWEIPAGETTGKNGVWKDGPGTDFFEQIEKSLGKLPFVAEDLGDISDAVLVLRDELGLPGMKVLQFAFGHEMPQSPFIPHNYTPNFVVYPGTHDNNTMIGWYRDEGHQHHHQIEEYLGKSLDWTQIPDEFCKLAFSSVAKIAILPIQDLMGLDENARMNTPGAVDHNWSWRLLRGQISHDHKEKLKYWTYLYNREAKSKVEKE